MFGCRSMFDLSGKTVLMVETGSGIGSANSQWLAVAGAGSYVTGSFMLVAGR